MALDASTFREPTAQAPGDFKRNKQGTPYVTDPAGELVKAGERKGEPKLVMYARPSSYGKTIENTYNLEKWGERTVALGIAVDYDAACEMLAQPALLTRAIKLVGRDRDTQEWREEADGIVVEAKRLAKAALAADRGTHAHAVTEEDDSERDWIAIAERGEHLGLDRDVQAALVQAWREMLAANELELLATEAPVVNDEYRAAGSLDRIVRLGQPLRFALVTGEIVELPAGLVVVLDIKSGQCKVDGENVPKFWRNYAVQIYLYASAVPYDPPAGTRGVWPFEVDTHWALIAHLDVLAALDGQPSCTLRLVDLEAGRHAADLCRLANDWGKRKDVFSVAQLDTIAAADAVEPSEEVMRNALSTSGAGEATDAPQQDAPPAARRITDAPDPKRLELVEAWATLAVEPDQGADLSGVEHDRAWAAMAAHHVQLDDATRSWYAAAISASRRHGLTIHPRERRTLRTFEIHRGLLALCQAGYDDDEVLRALLALVLDSDVPLFAGVEPGHALGSLSAAEAQRFAGLVDTFVGPGLSGSIDDDGTLRLAEVAA